MHIITLPVHLVSLSQLEESVSKEKIQAQCALKIRGEKNNETGCFDSTDCHDNSFYHAGKTFISSFLTTVSVHTFIDQMFGWTPTAAVSCWWLTCR